MVLWNGERYRMNGLPLEKIVPVRIASEKFGGDGKYVVEIDIVEEGIRWMSGIGGQTVKLNVTVEGK